MIYVDDKLPSHPKIYRAGAMLGENGPAQALSLFVAGLAYAREHLTDGFLPDKFVVSCALVETPLSVAKALCSRKVKLWYRARGEYRIHDYHDWNKPAAEIKQKRAVERAKKAEQRATGNGHPPQRNSRPVQGQFGASSDPVPTSKTIENGSRFDAEISGTDYQVPLDSKELNRVSPPKTPGDKSRTSCARASTIHDPRTTTPVVSTSGVEGERGGRLFQRADQWLRHRARTRAKFSFPPQPR